MYDWLTSPQAASAPASTNASTSTTTTTARPAGDGYDAQAAALSPSNQPGYEAASAQQSPGASWGDWLGDLVKSGAEWLGLDYGSEPAAAAPERAVDAPTEAASETGPLTDAEREQLATWMAGGERGANALTDRIFYARHPDLQGQRLAAGAPEVQEWVTINEAVQGALQAPVSEKAPAAPTPDASGATGDYAVTAEREAAAAEAVRAHMATYGEALPEWQFNSGKKAPRTDWFWKVVDAAFYAAFPHAVGQGASTDAARSAYWVLGEGVVARELNALYAAGADPTAAARLEEVDERVRVGLTDVPCESSELRALLAYERLPADQAARAHALIAQESEALRPAQYEALSSKVYYANQRDNVAQYENSSGGTCNLTALAMAMQAGGFPNPDPALQYEEALLNIARRLGLAGKITHGTTYQAIVADQGGQFADLGAGKLKRAFWEGDVATRIQSGWGVFMSITGHLVRVEAVLSGGLRIDDPYGASILKAGEARGWSGSNGTARDRTDADYNVGENITYPWADIEGHSMRTVLAVRR